MALSFSNTKGKAASNKVETYAYKEGDNVVRMFGGVLARYVYWVKGTNNKDIPLECLAFNRETEKFDNAEEDIVPTNFPDKKCQWAYSVNIIDPTDGKAKALNLKKKLFEAIITTAEDLGDPTDPEEGWDIAFKRLKTGPKAFNVEYQLQPLKCKKRSLSEAELAEVEKSKTIDEKYPRPTKDDIQKTITKIQTGASEEEAGSGDETPEEAKDL